MDLPGANFEIDAVIGHQVAEALGDADQLDDLLIIHATTSFGLGREHPPSLLGSVHFPGQFFADEMSFEDHIVGLDTPPPRRRAASSCTLVGSVPLEDRPD